MPTRAVVGSSRLSSAAPHFQSLLRIVAGFLFFCHGAQKILGLWGGHKAPMVSYPGLAGILEMIGGLLIIFGLFTRITAFILCGEMAVAYFRVHAANGKGPLPIENGGELAVLYCFLFLWFVFAGAGPISLDAIARRKT